MYVGKGYFCELLFKINVLTVVPNIIKNNKASSSTYIFESYNLWHHTLGYVNFNSIHKLMNLSLFPSFHFNTNNKCEIYIETMSVKCCFIQLEKK